MYIYAFTRFAGPDKVFTLAGEIKCGPGDLLRLGSEYFLCLGKKISFEELYLKAPAIDSPSLERVCPKFLSKHTLALLHRMAATYYTTYKSVVGLFLSDDIETLLRKESKISSGKAKKGGHPECSEGYKCNNYILRSTQNDNDAKNGFTLAEKGQTLIVFPDLRTLTNGKLKMEDGEGMVTLLASQTQNQKDVHRWEIKKGMTSVIICTYAEIFQDFHDLKKIIRVDPHKRYYANQQDPRYKVGEVLKKLAEFRGAELEISGI